MGIGTILIIISAALAVSEGLALIPGVKSNSVFQMIYLILKSIVNGIRSKEV